MSGEHPSLWEPAGPPSSGNERISCSPSTEPALFWSSASLGTVIIPLCSLFPLVRPHWVPWPPSRRARGTELRLLVRMASQVRSQVGAGPSPLIPDPTLSSPNKMERGILNTWSPTLPKINIPVFQKTDRKWAVGGRKPRACWAPGLVGAFLFVRGRKAAPVAMAT